MTLALSHRYRIDEDARRKRLATLGLGERDHAHAEALHDRVIRPHLGALITLVRRTIGAHPAQLVRCQLQALSSLGRDFDTAGYFEARMHAAHVAMTAHVSVATMVCLEQILASTMVEMAPPELQEPEFRAFVGKITTLDASLATDVYMGEQSARLIRELSAARAAERRQRRLAQTDSLTGLVNRASIDRHLAQAVAAAQGLGRALSVVMVDVDRFKEVNDLHGHAVGDEVLRRVAERMAGTLRDGDWIARYGGEEFLIALHDTPAQPATDIAERLRRAVADDAVEIGGNPLRVTISLGVATLRPDEAAHDLVVRADTALYTAKRAGRDQVAVRDTQSRAALHAS